MDKMNIDQYFKFYLRWLVVFIPLGRFGVTKITLKENQLNVVICSGMYTFLIVFKRVLVIDKLRRTQELYSPEGGGNSSLICIFSPIDQKVARQTQSHPLRRSPPVWRYTGLVTSCHLDSFHNLSELITLC